MIDNYDSFTYNLVAYLEELGAQVQVVRNDALTLAGIAALRPHGIVISPGPGGPRDAGISCAAIRAFGGRVPLLGVCLGLQCMYEVFGGTVSHAGEIVHGKTSEVTHDGCGLFAGLPSPLRVVRYHSLAATRETLPACLQVTATCRGVSGSCGEEVIQGVRHVDPAMHLEGVQFHPESILTECGRPMLANFLKWCAEERGRGWGVEPG